MSKNHQILVFGKAGCDKCKVLNKRIDSLLEKKEWEDFEKVYCDVETEDGLLIFCNAECINPQRIPAFMVTRRDPETGRYEPVPNPQMDVEDPICKDSRLYTHVGLQTDYSEAGRGLITPKMITTVLKQAQSA
jgi:hypothetical protein